MIAKKLLATASVVAGFMIGASSASAALIDLGFSLDQSGSVGRKNFNTTRNALADALASIPTSGANQYRLAVTKFGRQVTTVIAPTIVTGSNIASLQSTLRAASYGGGGTPTGRAITATFNLFNKMTGGLGAITLINITTDGSPNSQSAAESAATAAHRAGLDGLSFEAVGRGVSRLRAQKKMARIAGLGTSGDATKGVIVSDFTKIPNATTTGFVLPVSTFAAYEGAIKAKIGKVVIDTSAVPLPASLPLMLAGLGAFGMLRARRAA